MLRFRSFSGFIASDEATQEWIKNNPEFSVYLGEKQIGRISISASSEAVEVEVLEEGFEHTLNHIAAEVKGSPSSEAVHNYLQKDDLKIGGIIYVAHPFFGIDTIRVMSEPFMEESVNSLFIKSQTIYKDWIYNGQSSLYDAGLLETSYNLRRTFSTMQEAKAYVEYMLTLNSTFQHQAEHEKLCAVLWDDFE